MRQGAKAKKADQTFGDKVGGAVGSVREWTEKYLDDVEESYYVGYAAGYEAAGNIPDRLATRSAASIGFGQAVGDKRRGVKATKRYNKSRSKRRK